MPKYTPIKETDLAEAIGARLKQARTERKLTSEKVADAAEVSRRSYSEWEQGQRLPRLDTLLRLANFYNTPIEALIAGNQ